MFYLEITALVLLSLITLMGVIGTQLSRLSSGKWWVRMWDFPRYQLAFFTAVAFASFAYLWRGAFAAPLEHPFELFFLALLIGAFVYQLYRIYPYTPLANTMSKRLKEEDKSEDPTALDDSQISVMVSNVYQYNEDRQRLIDLVRDVLPCVLIAIETDQAWVDALDALQDTHPYRVAVPLENTYGMVLYSRLPLVDEEVRHIVDDEVPSIKTRVCLPSGECVTLFALHPVPPYPEFSATSLKRDVELIELAQEIEDLGDEPVIVAGDLNDVAWSNTTRMFLRLSKTLDPRCGRGMFNTFHANIPPLRVPLDHIFHSKHFHLCSIRRLPSIGSDHFPMYIRLAHAEAKKEEQSPLEMNEQTRELTELTVDHAEDHQEIDVPARAEAAKQAV